MIGRPKSKNPKNKRMVILLTEEQYKRVENYVQAVGGSSVGETVRDIIVDATCSVEAISYGGDKPDDEHV